jgi:hypothetical protein
MSKILFFFYFFFFYDLHFITNYDKHFINSEVTRLLGNLESRKTHRCNVFLMINPRKFINNNNTSIVHLNNENTY